MEVQLQCPSCGSQITVDKSEITGNFGMVKCPHCKNLIQPPDHGSFYEQFFGDKEEKDEKEKDKEK